MLVTLQKFTKGAIRILDMVTNKTVKEQTAWTTHASFCAARCRNVAKYCVGNGTKVAERRLQPRRTMWVLNKQSVRIVHKMTRLDACKTLLKKRGSGQTMVTATRSVNSQS